MNEENIYKVYGHLNVTNGKWYVGMTSLNLEKRWNNGKGYKKQPKMWNDIQNSDWNADWIHTIFNTFYNKEDALNYESLLIAMLDSVENGYNISAYDSNHYKKTEEHKNKISESMTGKTFTEEHRKHISESMNGHEVSEETKKKMAESKGVYGIIQYSKEGKLIAEYPSLMEPERQTGCKNENICPCCKGKLKSTGGYIWKYKE